MRKIISLICLLLPALAFSVQAENLSGEQPQIRSNAPDRHVVVKGDTLWDISGKFFEDPWKWPYIWGMNKDTIQDPHWIYPGDVIILDRTTGRLSIGEPKSSTAVNITSDASNTVRMSPKVRASDSLHGAISSIPTSAITPFLSIPLVVEENELKNAPTLLGAREGRVVLGTDDIGFVKGILSDKATNWQLYRPGKQFIDPDTNEVLGTEAVYLGKAEMTSFAEISTIKITNSVLEIYKGDRLVTPPDVTLAAYLPRAPENSIMSQVISVYGGVSQAGQNTVVTINKGKRDGLEIGHVLALYRKGETVKYDGDKFTLPDERYGLMFVFRVFDKVSYALVMQTRLPVQLLDRAQTP